jgi:hypothetical protein
MAAIDASEPENYLDKTFIDDSEAARSLGKSDGPPEITIDQQGTGGIS